MSDWQPIETAPKDGTHILLWGPGFGAFEASWSPNTMPPTHPLSDECWDLPSGDIVPPDAPTHWMPLPEPPTG